MNRFGVINFALSLNMRPYSAGAEQRGAVHVKQAEMALRGGEPTRAAAYYAKAGAAVSFERVCLGFLERVGGLTNDPNDSMYAGTTPLT